MAWVDVILQGVMLGGLYALFALGLSLSFGIMRLINLAHGDFIVVGAYLALVVVELGHLTPLQAILVVCPIMAMAGYALQRSLLNKVLGDDIMPALLVTFGLSVILQNGLQEIFSADTRGLAAGPIQTASLSLGGGLVVGWLPLLTVIIAILVIIGLQVLFSNTSTGRAFRATSDDQEAARLMGINTPHLYALAMALSTAVVSVAAVLLALRTTFSPSIGPSRLLYAFEAVIIGGLGSLWGTMAGGIILGISQTIGFKINPGFGVLAGHLAFLVVLIVRPQGLFPRTRGR